MMKLVSLCSFRVIVGTVIESDDEFRGRTQLHADDYYAGTAEELREVLEAHGGGYDGGVIIATDVGSGGSRTHFMVLDNEKGKHIIGNDKTNSRIVTKVKGGMAKITEEDPLQDHCTLMVHKFNDKNRSIASGIQQLCNRAGGMDRNCLDTASGKINWYIRATAGMREYARWGLNATARWKEVTKYVQLALGDLNKSVNVNATTIEGWKEGQYAYGTIQKMTNVSKPAIAMDCGGASTQYAFPYAGKASDETLKPEEIDVYNKLFIPVEIGMDLTTNSITAGFSKDELSTNRSLDVELPYYYNTVTIDGKAVAVGSFLAAAGQPGKDSKLVIKNLPFKNTVDSNGSDENAGRTHSDRFSVSNIIGGLQNMGGEAMKYAPECVLQFNNSTGFQEPKADLNATVCWDKLIKLFKADPFVKAVEEPARVYRKVAKKAGIPTYLFANYAIMTSVTSGMGLTQNSKLNELKTLALKLWTRKDNNFKEPVKGYLRGAKYGGNAGVLATFYYFMLVELYGYDANQTLDKNLITVLGDVKRPWFTSQKITDKDEELNWIPGLVVEETKNTNITFYSL